MTAPTHKKRRRGRATKQKKQSTGRLLQIGSMLFVIGLLAFGSLQFLGGNQQQTTSTALASNETLESLNLAGEHSVSAEPGMATDRETRFLGAASDSATVSLAQAGQLDQPTLLWFHADWCHICQQIKPEVIDLGEEYAGKVKIVRLNVDHAAARAAAQQYGVRATPTFVLFDAKGQVRGQVAGWPGYQAFSDAFDQLVDKG